MSYLIRHADCTPDIAAGFEDQEWGKTVAAPVMAFRPDGNGYHPEVAVKLLYDNNAIYGLFQVKDSHVRCVKENFQDSVCRDSCVEFFVTPALGQGYTNFEMSGSGVLLAMHVSDPARDGDHFAKSRMFTPEEVAGVKLFHTLPDKVFPEKDQEMTYRLGFKIPFSFFKNIFGQPIPVPGAVWRGNFYKCADDSSQPHWQSWTPVNVTNYHVPAQFGQLIFG